MGHSGWSVTKQKGGLKTSAKLTCHSCTLGHYVVNEL